MINRDIVTISTSTEWALLVSERYLDVLPFHLAGRRVRHEAEMDYLYHLQVVVEILQKYDQLDYIPAQIKETKKNPQSGTVPECCCPTATRLDPKTCARNNRMCSTAQSAQASLIIACNS
mmetsp:Transcript_13183/g.27702  ORF Transcript_13183/g.27702 Transcript_13183/m.27702 type:complete len:120 (-) Transcript_13183:312-671(-)